MRSSRTMSRDFRVGLPGDLAPMIGDSLQSLGGRVRLEHAGIAKHLELLVVVRGQDRLDEEIDGVLVKVRRDIADPQSSIGRAVVLVRRGSTRQRLGVSLAPFHVLVEQLLCVVSAHEVEGIQQVAVLHRIVRPQCQRLAITLDGFFGPALRVQGDGHVSEQRAAGRAQLESVAAEFQRRVGLAGLVVDDGQARVGLGIVGLQPQGFLKRRHRLIAHVRATPARNRD